MLATSRSPRLLPLIGRGLHPEIFLLAHLPWRPGGRWWKRAGFRSGFRLRPT